MSKMTFDTWMKDAIAKLANAGIDNPRLDARLLLCHHMQLDVSTVIAFPEREIAHHDILKLMLDRRLDREPLSHIVGTREFWSMEFKVNSDVLDPRPDSETLIEALLDRIADKNAALDIIDFGTGSGCLLLALLSELPNAKGLGVDLSEKALIIANENAKMHGLDERCEFIQSNWGDKVQRAADIILSNPPYIPSRDIADLQIEVKKHEPHLALDGGVDGLNPYPIISKLSAKLLKKGGIIGFEFGIGQEVDVQNCLKNAGFLEILTHQDLGGITRVATASLSNQIKY